MYIIRSQASWAEGGGLAVRGSINSKMGVGLRLAGQKLIIYIYTQKKARFPTRQTPRPRFFFLLLCFLVLKEGLYSKMRLEKSSFSH